MSNQAQIDYDKQFQDDLAKATALSLEQQALDDYRRNKKYGSGYPPSAAGRDYNVAQRSQSLNQGRRHSEVHQAISTSTTNVDRSRTPPAQVPDNDLICFASPTSKQPESATPFGRLIEDLQRMQVPSNPQSALVPMGPVAAAPVSVPASAHYGYHPHQPQVAQVQPPPYGMVAGAPGSMQLVPYQPAAQQQQRPLNNEELQRLYSMPAQLAVQPVAQPNAYLYYPGAVVTPYTAPIVPGSAAYMPPQYPSQGYGFGGAYTHMDLRRPQSTPVTPGPATSHHIQPSNNTPVSSSSVEANGVAFPARRPVPSTASVGSRPGSNGQSGQRRGNDLIDLNQEDYSRVSVLEAFDPLLNDNTAVSQK
ncbi:arginine-glutamic acid dipeptide repeats protein isoform X3 [Drosophila kikkawai]|uniref:Arginine-glutamic acid dipeptide repeats protein isoform X3 n=1 Tax=Drosophila kikkawai TaxID=30033 RepID=A0A6P4IEU2_DROKI|nr:mediator of RNA polymerase II transcription subunit 29 isoform X2 [Drosophila kikkawai]